MKLLIVALAFLSTFTYAVEKRVNLNANCYVNGGANAVCEVCNFAYSRPVQCAMQIRGLTSRRFWFNGHQNGIVYPGQCMNGYVYANNPYVDPLIDAQARVNCRF